MRFYQGQQAFLNFCKGFGPSRFDKCAITLDEWGAKAVWVFMQVFELYAFGADIAVAKYILLRAADADHLVALGAYFEPATGLAQRADAVMGFFGCGGGLRHGASVEIYA